MLNPANNKIIVRCNPDQKNTFKVGGEDFVLPIEFETNYREKSPVICQSESSNEIVSVEDILLCHHNTFYGNSPYQLHDDLFSIPENGTIIFVKLNPHDGSLFPIYGNLLCDVVEIEGQFSLPEKEGKYHSDRIVVTNSGYTKYKKGQLIFTRPHAAYQIVYNWNGELKRSYKCYEQQICGILIPDNQ